MGVCALNLDLPAVYSATEFPLGGALPTLSPSPSGTSAQTLGCIKSSGAQLLTIPRTLHLVPP